MALGSGICLSLSYGTQEGLWAKIHEKTASRRLGLSQLYNNS